VPTCAGVAHRHFARCGDRRARDRGSGSR